MMTGGGLMLVLLGRGFVMVLEVRERVRERDDKNTSVRDVRVLCAVLFWCLGVFVFTKPNPPPTKSIPQIIIIPQISSPFPIHHTVGSSG